MALTPEYLQGLPEELENLTMQFEADIIADISRRIAKAGAITDTAEYQMMLLKEMGASTEYLEKLIAQYTGLSDAAVKQMIFDAAQTDSDFYRSVYARVNRPYVPFEYNEYLQQLADAAVNQTCGELSNFTRSMGFSTRGTDGRIYFTPAADTYRACMDKAHLYTAAGMDYRSACRMATAGITAAGLQFVDYASGVRNHADVAVRRALLTGVSQMTGQISLRNAQALDTDVVEVSAHAGARPDHAAWQGKWFSLSGKDRRYPQLAAATGYGTVSGLKGANCRHDFYPVIPGIDEPAYTEEQLRNIDPPPVTIDGRTYTYYEAEQRQRAFERAIRKTKREIIAADASGDEEMFTAKSVLLRRQKEAYGEFSKKAGLLPRIERTGVAEYGRSISARAVWADRKETLKSSAAALTTAGKSVTINAGVSTDSSPNKPLKYFSSREYRDKFKEFGDNPLVTRSMYKCARKTVEANYLSEEDEDVYLIGSLTGKKYKHNHGSGGKVSFDAQSPNKVDKSFIVIHNHPNNSPLSLEDIVTASSSPEINRVIAASHDGKLYYLEIGNGTRLSDYGITIEAKKANTPEWHDFEVKKWAYYYKQCNGDYFETLKALNKYENYGWKVGVIE